MNKTIANITLAFWILLSTAGITVNKHFCQKQLKSMAIFIAPQNCHQQENSCHMAAVRTAPKQCCSQNAATQMTCAATTDGNCCQNESELLKNDTQLISNHIQQSISPDIQVVTLFYTLKTYGFEPITSFISKPIIDDPPPLQRDIPLLVQAFLC